MDQLKVPSFDPKQCRPSEWLHRFELVAEASDWDSVKKAKVVRLFLTGSAAPWYDTVVEQVPAVDLLPNADSDAPKKLCFKAFKRLLLAQFEGEDQRHALRALLEKTRQEERQSIADFNIFFMDVARRLGETNVGYLVRTYTNALLPALRKEIVMSRADTLEAAREVAELAERAHAPITPVEAMAPVPQRYTEEKIDSLTRALRELQSNVHDLQQFRSNSDLHRAPRTEPRRRSFQTQYYKDDQREPQHPEDRRNGPDPRQADTRREEHLNDQRRQ